MARGQSKNASNGRMIPTEDIFAMACAAQRINGQYVKETHTVYENGSPWLPDGSDAPFTLIKANKVMLREWIASNNLTMVTDADRQEAEAVRGYWQLKLFNVLNETANDYEKASVTAAAAETISSHDHKNIGIIASLPQAYERGVLRDKRLEVRQEAAAMSKHFGRVGDAVAGKIRIIDCVYSQNWLCYYITGQFDGNMVMFSFKEKVDTDKVFNIRGKVKKHRDDNVTQLNYVKLS